MRLQIIQFNYVICPNIRIKVHAFFLHCFEQTGRPKISSLGFKNLKTSPPPHHENPAFCLNIHVKVYMYLNIDPIRVHKNIKTFA